MIQHPQLKALEVLWGFDTEILNRVLNSDYGKKTRTVD
jgi:hypothetical protein